MSLLRRYSTHVMHHPSKAIAALVLLTLLFGWAASGVSFSSNEEDFLPTSDVAQANATVTKLFGSQGSAVTIVASSDANALSRDSLLSLLALEKDLLASDAASGIIERSYRSPTGIRSVASLVAQSLFAAEAFQAIAAEPGAYPGDAEAVQGDVLAAMLSLTPEDMRTIVSGGQYDLGLGGMPLTLTFAPYEPEMLGELIGASPFPDAFSFLISRDFDPEGGTAKRTIMSVSLAEGVPEAALVKGEQEMAALAENRGISDGTLTYRVLGDALVSQAITDASGKNIGMIMTLALVLVVAILAFVYRSIRDMALTILALGMAITWVFGAGRLLSFSFNPAITTVPVLIIGLGIDYGIHYNMRYREEVRKGLGSTPALIEAGSTVGFAIFLATVTTLVGFLSNVSSTVPSIRQFGILCAIGITSSWIVMVTFFPAAKAILDGRKERKGLPLVPAPSDKTRGWGWAKGRTESHGCPDPVCASGRASINRIVGLGAVASRRPALVLAVLAVITIAGAYEGLQLEARYDFRDFLPDGIEETRTTNIIFDEFSFSTEVITILATGDVADPAVLSAAAEAEQAALLSPYAVLSEPYETPLALARQLATPGSPTYDKAVAAWWQTADRDGDGLPDPSLDSEQITELYDLLFAAVPDAAGRVLHREGGRYTAMALRFPVNSRNGVLAPEVTASIVAASGPLEALEGGPLSAAVVTGGPAVQNEILSSINDSQISSVGLTLLASLLILTALYNSLKRSKALGFITLLPLVFVIIWTAGGMHLLGIPLNVVTVTIAAITVGLGIDYSIHVTQRFLEDVQTYETADCALCVAVHHTGSALFGSAATTVLGFGLLSLSIIPPLSQFGKVTALSVAFSFLAAVYVLPTFIKLWYGSAKKK
ncbi:MAG: MMPL family transporter [Candidatus Methanofastidiosa archaeon]|nr:MMPL family transporter [Candidatus Methanofastidiosa archaeon]